MALSLQKKLELAGDLAKVQPLLQRLHLVEKPKQRHRVRNVILVSSAISAVVILVAVARGRRACCDDNAGVGESFSENAGSSSPEAPTHGARLATTRGRRFHALRGGRPDPPDPAAVFMTVPACSDAFRTS